MSNTNLQSEGGSAAQTISPSNRDESLSRELLEHLARLRLIRPVINVSVMALRRQDAEDDVEIASVLDDSACCPLDDEIERIESILATRVWSPRQEARV
jgi:hypothetical protein